MVPVKAPEVQQAVKEPIRARAQRGSVEMYRSAVWSWKNTEAVRPVSSGWGGAQGSVRGAHSGHVT